MPIKTIQFSFIFIFFLLSFSASSQKGSVRGTIFDKETGEPIIYGTVQLEGTSLGASTDINGFFVLSAIPIGDYNLVSTYIGYDSLAQEVTVNEGITNLTLFMTSEAIQLSTVNISAQRQQARSEVQISQVSVSSREIKALPSAGGEPDIAQYLQVLPGVISTGDQGGQIFIRGGSPVQNRITLDGLTIFNPFHSIGFFSIFETELIRNVDVFTGGFNAEYGGRISAIVDLKTREGNKKRFGGTLSANPFVVKALVEGPIIPLSDSGNSLSFVLTSKKSIIEQTSKTLYDYAARVDTLGLPFDFQDTYGKVSFVSGNGSKFNVFGFNFVDEFNDPGIAKVGWTTAGGGMNFNLVPSSSDMIMKGNVGYSSYNVELGESEDSPRRSELKSFNVAMDFTIFGRESEINYGFDITAIRTNFEFTNPFGLNLEQFQNTTEISAFGKYRKKIGGLVIEPGVRLQYYASLGEFSLEPRIGLKYNINDRLRVKAAGGVYTQNLISTSNERDVVNLFTGFLSGPESRVVGFDGENIESKLQKANHAVGGIEFDLTDQIQLNFEGYLKDYNQLIIVNRNKTLETDPDYAVENGEAYGLDFSLKYETGPAYVWATYSLGYVNRFDGEQTYPTIFDRRHNVNFLASYAFGGDESWQLSLRWNMGSGFPFTQTQGFYNNNSFQDGVSTDVVESNPQDVGIIFANDRNGGRLPYYHRMDISLEKSIKFSKYSSLDIILGATNIYNRENIFYFDRVEYDRVDQLPIIPSIGLRFKI